MSTDPNKRILKVIVEQAEGLTVDCVPVTFEGPGCVERANEKLRSIAANGPDLGYYKTDVTITLVDGSEFEFRFDIMKSGTSGNDTDVVEHAIRTWRSYGALEVPAPSRDKYTLSQWEQRMISTMGAESVMEFRRLYNVLVPPVASQETEMDRAQNRIFN